MSSHRIASPQPLSIAPFTHTPPRPLAPYQVGINVPLVVRLEGTNVEAGKKILKGSPLKIIAADDLDDAAVKAVASLA